MTETTSIATHPTARAARQHRHTPLALRAMRLAVASGKDSWRLLDRLRAGKLETGCACAGRAEMSSTAPHPPFGHLLPHAGEGVQGLDGLGLGRRRECLAPRVGSPYAGDVHTCRRLACLIPAEAVSTLERCRQHQKLVDPRSPTGGKRCPMGGRGTAHSITNAHTSCATNTMKLKPFLLPSTGEGARRADEGRLTPLRTLTPAVPPTP
ncbi:hypothetical protein FHR61_000479 [Xanthomonas arboricola]|uniref:Uncharacterized protein n=1 Tax=Xanthomonas cannabis TaxID=1885674 RepID=A0ABR6JJ41_9XANT|nr:hypothetical protein [Xanthomonas cannabis]MBB5520683.1 hypothetical protein [Xanthomonas cannabis]